MRKSRDFMRGVMMHEQWLEDGRKIGRLVASQNFLAQKLAELGVHPSQTFAPQASQDEIDLLAKKWREAGHKAAEAFYAEIEGRRVSG